MMFFDALRTLGEEKLGIAGDRGVRDCSSEGFVDRSCGPLVSEGF